MKDATEKYPNSANIRKKLLRKVLKRKVVKAMKYSIIFLVLWVIASILSMGVSVGVTVANPTPHTIGGCAIRIAVTLWAIAAYHAFTSQK